MAAKRPSGLRLVGLLAALVAMVATTGAAAAEAKLVAHGSAEQVYATGLAAGRPVSLLNGHGQLTATRRADSLGGVLFRHLTPGSGYRLRQAATRSRRLTVFSNRPAPPSIKLYGQKLARSGYGYLTTRDGTKLAYDVHLPAGPGPHPTVVEYSGYGYADPVHGPDSGIAQVANILGFAVVDVNMRGTGCSGGAYDYFEALQSLDGYDVIETVARQPWVLHHKVGMLGVSYGAISQLFVAATNPPHLVAIAPLSVIDNTATTLYPGGILNTGFALSWGKERVHDARPAAATGGQPWARAQIQGGDRTCQRNQALHGEAANLIAKIRANAHYVPAVADPLAPITFVNKIHVPVYLACQWTDEQTGGHCADLASHFTGTQRKWFTFTNGNHIDSLDPATFNRWYDFLELYVARQAPHLSATARAFAPSIYQAVLGISGVTLPPDPIQRQSTYASARSAFERLAPVRVLFDNGAGGSQPGYPYAAFERSFARFPIPSTRARSWYLGAGGRLGASPPQTTGAERLRWRRHARPATDFTGSGGGGPGGLWTNRPSYNWAPSAPGTAAVFVTAPLATDTTVIGAGAVHLWIKASRPNVDLQTTLTEVRPDGRETYVQSGWLRTDERKLDPAQSTLLAPVLSRRAADVARLPRGRLTEVTVPLYYEGHVYRKGSRLALTISAPGGDQPVWAFAEASPTAGSAIVTIAHSARYPARVILPVVPGVTAPTPLPPCPALRGEPCRAYTPYRNTEIRRGA